MTRTGFCSLALALLAVAACDQASTNLIHVVADGVAKATAPPAAAPPARDEPSSATQPPVTVVVVQPSSSGNVRTAYADLPASDAPVRRVRRPAPPPSTDPEVDED